MKKLIILFFAIILSGTIAGSAVPIGLTLMGGSGTSGGEGGGGGDECSADAILFSWYAENTTIGGGTPVGCSMGDTTATANDSIVLSNTQNRSSGGTNSAYVADMGKYYAFDGSSEDIFHTDAGTITFYVYITTWVNNSPLIRVYGDAQNRILVKFWGDGTENNRNVGFAWRAENVLVSEATNTADLVLNSWCGIKVEYDISENPDWQISFDLNNDGNFTNSDSGNIDPGAMGAGTFDSFELRIGEDGSFSPVYYIDDIKILDTESL